MSDPRDKTNLTASEDNVPFGGSGSPSPIKIGATSHFSAHTAGGDLLGELSAHERMLQEYEWAATFRDNAHDIVVPDIFTSSGTTDYHKWELNLIRSLVGKMPYLLHHGGDGARLLAAVDTPLQRRGNRILYTAVWEKLTSHVSAGLSDAELFQNSSSAALGDGLELVRELKVHFSYGDEENNVAIQQLNKLQLAGTSVTAVTSYLDKLDSLRARAGPLANNVTVITHLETNFKRQVKHAATAAARSEAADYEQVIRLARLLDKWNSDGVVKALRNQIRDKRMEHDMTADELEPVASRRSQQRSVVESAVCSIHGPGHSDEQCRAQQKAKAKASPGSTGATLDPALPRGTCNAYYIHGECRRGERCRWKHDVTKATESPSGKQCAMPNLIDLDEPAQPLPPLPRPASVHSAIAQLADLPTDKLTAVVQAFVQARDRSPEASSSRPAKQCAVKRLRAVADPAPAPAALPVVVPLEPAAPAPAPLHPPAAPAVDVAAPAPPADELSERFEQLRLEAAADRDKPRCGSTATTTGKPCQTFVKRAGMRCSKHDEATVLCDGKTKAGKPCSFPALPGMTKCKKHAKEYLGAGGDSDTLRRPADVQATVASYSDDRVIADTGATNHTSKPGDVVQVLPGQTLCETNGGFVQASRGLAHVPLEPAPQPTVVLDGPRCASVDKLTLLNPIGQPSRFFGMAGGEAGFVNDPVLAARFLDEVKRCGAWSALDVVDGVPLFPRNLSLLAPAPPPVPSALPADLCTALEAMEEFVDACESLDELLHHAAPAPPAPRAALSSAAREHSAPRVGWLGKLALLGTLLSPAQSAPALEGVNVPVASTDAVIPERELICDTVPTLGPVEGALNTTAWLECPQWKYGSLDHKDPFGEIQGSDDLHLLSPVNGIARNSSPYVDALETFDASPSLNELEADPAAPLVTLQCATKHEESDDVTKFSSVKRLPKDIHAMTHRGGCSGGPGGHCAACEAAKLTQNPLPSKSGYDREQDQRIHLDTVGPSRPGAAADGATATHFTLGVVPSLKRMWVKMFKKKPDPQNTISLLKKIEKALAKQDESASGVRADGGPEMKGHKLDEYLEERNISIDRAIPGEHAHLIERYVRTVTEGVRAARLAAGLPASSWPAALEMWVQNWEETVAGVEREDCDVSAVPFGVGVRYAPAEDEKVKERRFEANARVGVVIGYSDTCPRAYQVLDLDLLKSGKWRATTTRAARPLVDESGEPVFPARLLSNKHKKAAENVFNRRAGGSGGSTQLAMKHLERGINDVVTCAVTREIPSNSSEFHTDAARAARQAEADKLNSYGCFDWATLAEWDNVTCTDDHATRVSARMMLSSKFEELAAELRELKGRYILQGHRQMNKDGRNILSTWKADNPELWSCPLQRQEMRAMLAGGMKAGKTKTKLAVVDEESAYIQEVLDGDAVWLDLRKESARDIIPPELRDKVEAMNMPVVKVHKACYGLKRAVFSYEQGRDERILSTGAQRVKGTRCVFKYTDSQGHSAFLGVFIDDALLVGHEEAVAELLAKLQNKRADGTPLFVFKKPPELALTAHVLGVDIRLELREDHAAAYLSAANFVKYWTTKFETKHGVRLKSVRSPSTPPQPKSPSTGQYAESARSVVMAAYWHARMCAPAMIQPCCSLARRFEDWSYDEDRRLLHALAYWRDHAHDELELKVGYNDSYSLKIYCDSDHASDPFSRRSTTGSAMLLTGNMTRAILDDICKQQPRIARSSGDAESRGIDETVRALVDTADELTDMTHATSYALANKGVPLVEMLEDLGFQLSEKVILVDANVALISVCRGHSKLMRYLSKTQGVDLGWLSETIADLDFSLRKVDSSENLSDIFTKGVTPEVLEHLLPLLGISQGVTC